MVNWPGLILDAHYNSLSVFQFKNLTWREFEFWFLGENAANVFCKNALLITIWARPCSNTHLLKHHTYMPVAPSTCARVRLEKTWIKLNKTDKSYKRYNYVTMVTADVEDGAWPFQWPYRRSQMCSLCFRSVNGLCWRDRSKLTCFYRNTRRALQPYTTLSCVQVIVWYTMLVNFIRLIFIRAKTLCHCNWVASSDCNVMKW